MALDNRTAQQRIELANALDRASAAVRENVYRSPVNWPVDVQDALSDAKVVLDLAVAA